MSEVRQAVELMGRWAPIDPEDALELLGPNFAHPTVRKYAVSRLSHAPDEVRSINNMNLINNFQCLSVHDLNRSK